VPKKVSTNELQIIQSIISHHPEGIQLDELMQSKTITISRRTVQRRLTTLLKRGCIIVTGKGAGSRYQITSPRFSPYGQFQIALSEESHIIRNYVNQVLENRNRVKYNPSFLDSYQPNATYYLSSITREHLKKIGSHQNVGRIAGTYARKILHHLLIDLSWNSSRLEGNTYSILETERLLEFNEKPENKSNMETQMLLNHKAAIEFLVDLEEDITFNRQTILNLHALLSDNLLNNPESCGRLRSILVSIAGTSYFPLDMPFLIDEYFQKILDKCSKIKDPFEQAFFSMVHMPYLQPFEDVNKRVSRLAANIPLIKNNFSPLSFIDVPEKAYIDGMLGVYELNRIELLRDIFIWAYERSAAKYSSVQQLLGEPDPFRLKYRKELIELVGEIVRHCIKISDTIKYITTWIDQHIYEADRARFSEITEIELRSLHAGNIARFRIRPSEFDRWYAEYKKPMG
jgi:Fic family protein